MQREFAVRRVDALAVKLWLLKRRAGGWFPGRLGKGWGAGGGEGVLFGRR
jgi:hypothetical protein